MNTTSYRDVRVQAKQRAFEVLRRLTEGGELRFCLHNLRTRRRSGYHKTIAEVLEALGRHPILNEYRVLLTHRRSREEEVVIFDEDRSKALARAILENGHLNICKAEVL